METGQCGYTAVDDGRERYEQLVRQANKVANDDKLFEQAKNNVSHDPQYISGIDEQCNNVFYMAAVIRADKLNKGSNISMLNYIFGKDE